MKLVILGATGRTGKELVKQAVERGHTVTAVVRNPDAFKGYDKITVIKGDVTSAAELKEIIKGHDAVLSGLGNNNSKLHLIEKSTAAIIEAMRADNIKRLVVELAFGGAQNATLTKPARFVNKLFLSKMLVDQQQGVALLDKSELDWTVVYATILTKGALTNSTRVVDASEKISTRSKISRANVAKFMLDAAETGTYIKEMPVIRG